jgi:hypothetical protein
MKYEDYCKLQKEAYLDWFFLHALDNQLLCYLDLLLEEELNREKLV